MLAVGVVFALFASLVHVMLFFLESWNWTGERARTLFDISLEEALATKPIAFYQGFFSLFLAIEVAVGSATILMGFVAVGSALVLAGAGSMVAGSLVRAVSSPSGRAAAFGQGASPLIAVILTVIGLAG